jgi:hypothetical protein
MEASSPAKAEATSFEKGEMLMPPELLWGVGVVVLLGALVWGVVQFSTRNKANDRVTEKATREMYKHPETYSEGRREELKKEVRPS